MLRKLGEQVQTCFDRALDAKRKADETVDPAREADLRQIEKSWLALAESYELTERLTDFTAENAAWRRRFNERRRVGARQDDEARLQKIIQEGNVEALFERMWLSSIVEFSDDAIISMNLDGTMTSWNNSAERLFGYLAEEAIGKPVAILAPPERRGEDYAILEGVRRGDRVHNCETVRRRKNGSLIDVSVTVSPIRGAAGRVVGASRVVRDITERKRTEAHISVLAREAEHRAKNLLANVKAMVHLSQSDTPDGLKKAIDGRIEALANVHSLFVQSRWTGAELESLVKRELLPYSAEGVRTLINGGRHTEAGRGTGDGSGCARVGDQCGKVRLSVGGRRSGSRRVVALSRSTARIPLDRSGRSTRRRKGFGTHMIEAMIRGRECGNVRLNWHVDGLACEITLPTD
jgi:PAS domain S-box-containing protein